MGIYIFTWSKLRQALIEDEADPNSKNDFGGNIIPSLIAKGETCVAYRFHGYWKDVGTIASLWDANMDLLNINDGIQEFDKSWPIYARTAACPPHVSGPDASIKESLVAGGSEIDGTVNHSVIFENVTVEDGADVQYSVIMPGATVKAGAKVHYSILAENCVVEENASVGEMNAPIAVVAGGVVVDAGTSVSAGAMYTEESKGGEA
jgi:glucose-1-phosphate adenylyltransferase